MRRGFRFGHTVGRWYRRVSALGDCLDAYATPREVRSAASDYADSSCPLDA
jgi:hypothetical protein